MKLTLSIIRADIGSIGGHIAPSRRLLDAVRAHIRAGGRLAADAARRPRCGAD